MKLLLVEDQEDLATSIVSFLIATGYRCEWACTYQEADSRISMFSYDCALIDIMLPDGSGYQLVRNLRKYSPSAGIIVLSAKNSVDDKIKGLDLGADDYLPKPFHLAELHSRIKSLWRRRQMNGVMELVFNEIKIIPDQMVVEVHHTPVILTRKEYELLLFFITNQNRVMLKEVLAEHLSGDQAEFFNSFDFIYSHIKNLRKKLLDQGCADYIQSIYGVGYKFTAL
ncbi:MAG: response regulator transcription factor [Saprospiraceae bacterium]|nr:response regulator transcription factor [Saprospiraceae bacterium]